MNAGIAGMFAITATLEGKFQASYNPGANRRDEAFSEPIRHSGGFWYSMISAASKNRRTWMCRDIVGIVHERQIQRDTRTKDHHPT